MTTVCLAMMVKNEAHVITRALRSARPLVDAWLVVDTGSSDATRDVVRETMSGLPGEVVDRPWRGFGGSRADSFELARSRADYVVILDADDLFEYAPGAKFPPLTEPGYALQVIDGKETYPRIALMSSAYPWTFSGVAHEHAVCDGVGSPALLEGIAVRRVGGGHRDGDPKKYLKDAETLEAALRENPRDLRSVFYLARSYEDAGELARALANYERRVVLGGWPEEVYYSLYAIARVRERLGSPAETILAAYRRASEARPSRAEPLCEAARVARLAEKWGEAREFARSAMSLPTPHGELLPVDREVYAWRAIEEFAGASAHLGDFDAAIAANQRLLDENRVAPEDRGRIEMNIALCLEGSVRAKAGVD